MNFWPMRSQQTCCQSVQESGGCVNGITKAVARHGKVKLLGQEGEPLK